MHYSIAHLSHTCALKLVPDQHNAAAIQGFGFWRQFVKLYCGNHPLSLLRWNFCKFADAADGADASTKTQ